MYASMCVCVFVFDASLPEQMHMCVQLRISVCTCVWRPVGDTEYLPQSLSPLYIEVESLV